MKEWVAKNIKSIMYTNQLGRKKDYYVKEFNPTCEHDNKEYLGAEIKGKAKILIVQLRSRSHHLICEIGRWKVPKEEWEGRFCRFCRFCNEGVVETEWHYVKDCTAYKDIHNQHKETLRVNSIKYLFERPRLLKGAISLMHIHNKRESVEKSQQTE